MRLIYGPYLCKDGRLHCDVMYRGRNKTKHVLYARYVLEKKIGRPLRKGETVDHIDEDKTNDKPSNLQILSLADNSKKSANPKNIIRYMKSKEGREASSLWTRGEKNGLAKMTDKAVARMRRQAKAGTLDRKAECKRFGVGDKSIRNAITGVTYKHLDGAVSLTSGKSRGGRPPTYTDEQIQKWVKYRRKGHKWQDVADKFGVNVFTVIKKASPLV